MWQVERRNRTRYLIELGGLMVKGGLVDLINDDRVTIFGALLWMANKVSRQARSGPQKEDERSERIEADISVRSTSDAMWRAAVSNSSKFVAGSGLAPLSRGAIAV
ncbi:conjugal transfer protein TraD [Labrys neptuniae]